MKINYPHIYQWHSINLVPHFSATPIADEPQGDPTKFATTGRLYQLTWFGYMINILISEWNGAPKTNCGGRYYGPLWSRRKRRWYRDLD